MNAQTVQADTMGWAPIGATSRAVIVLRVDRGQAYVVWGTGSTGRSFPNVVIHHLCRIGVILGLKKPTAFYGTCTTWISASSISVRGKCYGKVLIDIHQAVQDAAPQLPPSQLVQQPPSPSAAPSPAPATPQPQAPVDGVE